MSAFAEEAAKSDKKHAKRHSFGLGYGGYSAGYGGLGYSSLGYGGHGYSAGYSGGHGYSSGFGYSGLGLGHSAAYVAPAHAHAHTHTHSIETKVVAQPVAVPQPYPVVRTQVVDRPVAG